MARTRSRGTNMRLLLTAALIAICSPAIAALNILACEPEWGALAKEIGGDKVTVYTATTALQDPHRIEARPSLIARARSADLMVCTGAELEIGWVPLLQTQSGNPKIQAGQPGYFEAVEPRRLLEQRDDARRFEIAWLPGYFEAAGVVALLEKPTRLDRSMGDI